MMKFRMAASWLFVLALAGGLEIASAAVSITEIMYRPSPSVPEDSHREWIELYNDGTGTVDLAGWKFVNGIDFTFTNATPLGPGAYLVVAARRANFLAQYPGVTNVVGDWSGKLADNGEVITLADAAGLQQARVAYFNEGEWAVRRAGDSYAGQTNWWRGWKWFTAADGAGSSLELRNLTLPDDLGQNWGESTASNGTPGAANSIATNDIAPMILDARHLPAIPKSTSTVFVTAQIVDELSTTGATVTLFYRNDGATNFASAAMLDDGGHGDGVANDGYFGATIAPRTNRTIVEFYVRAQDAGGHVRTWPGPTDTNGTQGANALYQVDDTVYAGSQPIYRFIITAAESNAWFNLMDNIVNGQYANSMANASVVRVDAAGTEARHMCSLRNRGAGSRASKPHNMEMAVPADRDMQGAVKLDFNTQFTHAQLAGNSFFSAAGILNTYGAPVQVRLNGANLAGAASPQFGSYYCFEPYESDWVRRHVGSEPDGNVYRGVWYLDNAALNVDATLDYLGTNKTSYAAFYSATGPTATSPPYSKQNNGPEDDWSDLINLTYVLSTNTPDSNYVAAVTARLNVDEWLKHFAINQYLNNGETTLATGAADDYSMFRGFADTRFQLINHDMDSILGAGAADVNQSIFIPTNSGFPMRRFLRDPAIAPRYFDVVKQLGETTFSATSVSNLLNQQLGSWVPAATIASMRSVATTRWAAIQTQIPLAATIVTSVPAASVVTGGVWRFTNAAVSFAGASDAMHTRSVRVNGTNATWNPWLARWTNVAPLALFPGLNRIVVEGLDANGVVVAATNRLVWLDTNAGPSIAGTLTNNLTLTALGGPWNITNTLTVAAGVTLTIEPCATLFFASNASLVVNGTLIATGTPSCRIQFTRTPGLNQTNSWAGITLSGAGASGRVSYADLEWTGSGAGGDCFYLASGAALIVDHITVSGTTKQWFDVNNSSLRASDSVFCPADNVEPIHGNGMPTNGFFILERNVFGPTTGYNDVCDYTGGNRPGPIAQFYDNVFLGASDDILDLDGTDAHIEGNIFMHVHKGFVAVGDLCSAVSGGRNGGDFSEITIARNLFYDCEYGSLCKETNFYTFQNNTFVGMQYAAVVFDEPLRRGSGVTPGLGAIFEGNIVWNTLTNFDSVYVNDPTWGTTILTNTLNIFQGADFVTNGSGNLRLDPRLVNTNGTLTAENIRSNFALRAGSPALGAGPNGLDMGALVPAGASISAVASPTPRTNLTLTIAGPGVVAYRASVNGGAYGPTNAINVPLVLTNLALGTNSVSVIGQNSAYVWQTNPTVRTWVCVTGFAAVTLSEVLADNGSAYGVNDSFRDAVELYNPGNLPLSLAGYGLSDNATNRHRFVFPTNAVLAGGGYLVVLGGNALGTNLTLGFNLDKDGGALWLSAPTNAGGAIVDTLEYGFQLLDFSVARVSNDWTLATPTLGGPNVGAPTGDRTLLKINEWLTASVGSEDFIEIYNADTLPVDMGRCYLTDSPEGWPAQFQIAPLSFIRPGAQFVFTADRNTNLGPSHVNFVLDQEWGTIGLFAPDLSLIDLVIYGPQGRDVSMGRTPNGGTTFATFPTPTPGSGNPVSLNASCSVTGTTQRLLAYTNVWRYVQTSNLDTVAWTATNYDDSAWSSGAGLLAFEVDATITALVRTVLNDPRIVTNSMTAGHAYYFRAPVVLASNLSSYALAATMRLDDGGVFYVNGTEVLRVRVNAGADTNGLLANANPPGTNSDATLDEVFAIPTNLLKIGTNIIAVSVHQSSATSSDIVFGLALDASLTVTNCISAYALIDEVMANNRASTNLDGSVSDWIELVNPTAQPFVLADTSLTDDPALPRRWVFPSNAVLNAGARVVVRFDSTLPASTNVAAMYNTGFGLDSDGDRVLFYDRVANGAGLMDSIVFGPQALDYSIARVPSATGTWTIALPTPGAGNLAAATASANGLRFNEWMAAPSSGEDWFELYNGAAQPVALGGLYLTDDLNNHIKFAIPALSYLGAGLQGGFMRFYADNTPALGAIHVNFKLDGTLGEALGLFAADTVTKIDSVTFGPQQLGASEGWFPDGSTNLTRFKRTPTPASANALPFTDVVVNEALTRPAGGQQVIELRNPSEQTVDLSGWWLSDSLFDPKKYRLPDPLILPPGAVATVTESAFNAIPGVAPSFALDPDGGGKIYLSLADSVGNLTGYRAAADYDDSESGVSFGAFDTSIGPQFVQMSALSLGATNPYPQVGPIVINEIHFHPVDVGTNDNTDDEFVELYNAGFSSVPLFDPALPTNTWHVRNAVSYDFPTNVTMPAGSYLLVVGFDPVTNPTRAATFRATFAVPGGVPLYGPWSGKLNNADDTIELNRPTAPTNGVVPRPFVDRIAYDNIAPWPSAPDGSGTGSVYSLQRKSSALFGNDPVNWVAGLPSAGVANNVAAGNAPGVITTPVSQAVALGGSVAFSGAATGAASLVYQWLQNGYEVPGATNATLTVTNVTWADTGRYALRVANAWGCALSSNAWLRIAEAPVILRHPTGATVNAGSPFTFHVVVRGTPPIAYQWKQNGTNRLAGNGALFNLGSALATDAGSYVVSVSNAYGATNSSAAVLAVIAGDSDGDGLPDWWETTFGTNSGTPDADADPDGDGMSNLAEYLSGTEPLNPASRFAVNTVVAAGTNSLLSFTAISNRTYSVQYRDDLAGGAWQLLQNVASAGTNRAVQVVVGPGSNRFFRVVTPQAP